jgi:hypothetical protein
LQLKRKGRIKNLFDTEPIDNPIAPDTSLNLACAIRILRRYWSRQAALRPYPQIPRT